MVDAIALHKEAIKTFETLTKAQATPDMEAELATTFDDLGRLYRKQEQNAQSEDALKQALAIWEKLIAGEPKEKYQAGLAKSQLRLGNMRQNVRDLESAQKLYEKSLAGWKKLADAH